MSSRPPPHDPSNPNDPRNWNGYPGPTFRVEDPSNLPRTILYSSFSLQPVPLHLLPPGAQYQIGPVPTDRLEDRLAQLPEGQAIPPDVLANPLVNNLIANVRSQNPQQTLRPTAPQLLKELRRQNALTAFQGQHMQLLGELTKQMDDGGSVFATFTSTPELESLLREIADLLGKKNQQVTAEIVHDEVGLRIREALSANGADHQIHQLQYLSSQLLQQVKREAGGDFTVPQELAEDVVYKNIESVINGQGLMSTHQAMADDVQHRITTLRQERSRQLREGSTDQPVQAPMSWPGQTASNTQSGQKANQSAIS